MPETPSRFHTPTISLHRSSPIPFHTPIISLHRSPPISQRRIRQTKIPTSAYISYTIASQESQQANYPVSAAMTRATPRIRRPAPGPYRSMTLQQAVAAAGRRGGSLASLGGGRMPSRRPSHTRPAAVPTFRSCPSPKQLPRRIIDPTTWITFPSRRRRRQQQHDEGGRCG